VPERDPLAAVREADRLVREATERAERIAGEVPPRGWAAGGEPSAATGGDRRATGAGAFGELAALAGLIELARGSIPPELARQLADALRQLLLALRALIDFWIERLDAGEPEPVRVEDIPIE
jgi:hypothetical protein